MEEKRIVLGLKERGLRLHQGTVKGLRERGLRLGRLSDRRKLSSSSGGGQGQLNVDDVGVHFRDPIMPKAEQIRRHPTEDFKHPFKVVVTGQFTVKVCEGVVHPPLGKSDPLVCDPLEVDESGDLTNPASGSIWMVLSWAVAQHSTTEVLDGGTTNTKIRLKMFRISDLTFSQFEWRTSDPVVGTNATDNFTTGSIWYKIADVTYDPELTVTKQYVQENIYAPEIADGALDSYI